MKRTKTDAWKRYTQKTRIAVILHLFYPSLWEEIHESLRNFCDIKMHLYVSLVENVSCHLKAEIKKKWGRSAKVVIVKNRGRDMGGAISVINLMDVSKYDYICKIHGKITPHWAHKGHLWRQDLFSTLIGSNERIKEVLSILETNPKIGMISCDKYTSTAMGSNFKQYCDLCKLLEIESEGERNCSFFAGSMFWTRADIIQRIKDSKLTPEMFSNGHNIDGTLAHSLERAVATLTRSMGYNLHGLSPLTELPGTSSNTFEIPEPTICETQSGQIKPICFYLPQFHAISENDKWWGKGFTEWTHVKKAVDGIVPGHRLKKPHPDIGYYDLSDTEIRKKQGEIARAHGIYGFCYHHYWFNGKTLLDKPLLLMLADGCPDIKFCFNWANENWTRTWDGLENNVLQKQTYGGEEDWVHHFQYLMGFFMHPNYIKVNNKPVFVIYRANDVPQLGSMIECWNAMAKNIKFDGMHVIAALNNFKGNMWECHPHKNVEGVCEFNPNFVNSRTCPFISLENGVNMLDNRERWQSINEIPKLHPTHYRGTYCGWDNSPRKGTNNSTIFLNDDVPFFQKCLERQLMRYGTEENASGERLFFINAWNEWGEGCVLEPEEQLQYSYLEAIQSAMKLQRIFNIHTHLHPQQLAKM